ncbi:non-heme iron oxygenase ferredoxin subunit [Candidatus Rhodoluna planktonica]|uniref:Non-heme iron oxygenase ferredoxin subunit n=1 Tax=Candidatus Rhodoluna planktonica TaxID=535712 RepID=A0A1D9DZ71_9MICO|nr:non-heme iron oxygenase ferredoxin subunit [Candidatus Rhodoluna planktonica]AOY56108.1 non-heme iron oxygenase ferredoxin subunit [Candidatus Rhodoluna planktonica]
MAIQICPVEDIKPGKAIRVKVGDHAIAIVRTKAGDVRAIDDKCSHGEISLSEGFVDNETIECWAHGAKFSLETGQPLTLPAYEPVAVYETFVEDGVIYLEYDAA